MIYDAILLFYCIYFPELNKTWIILKDYFIKLGHFCFNNNIISLILAYILVYSLVIVLNTWLYIIIIIRYIPYVLAGP
jgi:uncharacterized protein YqhQ